MLTLYNIVVGSLSSILMGLLDMIEMGYVPVYWVDKRSILPIRVQGIDLHGYGMDAPCF